jgi:hypothetical protein
MTHQLKVNHLDICMSPALRFRAVHQKPVDQLNPGKFRGSRPRRRLTLFACPKRVSRKRAPQSPGPLRGFPAPGRLLAVGQKLAALRHLSAFIAKRPPCSDGSERGRHPTEIQKTMVGAHRCVRPLWLKPPSLLKEAARFAGYRPLSRLFLMAVRCCIDFAGRGGVKIERFFMRPVGGGLK